MYWVSNTLSSFSWENTDSAILNNIFKKGSARLQTHLCPMDSKAEVKRCGNIFTKKYFGRPKYSKTLWDYFRVIKLLFLALTLLKRLLSVLLRVLKSKPTCENLFERLRTRHCYTSVILLYYCIIYFLCQMLSS